jgi:uncharacterized membrane protein
MTREAFTARLRAGLKGMPPEAAAEIVADYDAHFAEGAAQGRSETEIAAALGDPDRLARELRAEAGVKQWEARRSPEAAAVAVFAVLGLGAIDIIFLLPIVIALIGVLFGLIVAAIGVFVAGGVVFAVGPFAQLPGGPAVALLAGLGMMVGAVAAGAFLTLVSIGFTNALVWYGRLHYRLLKPAIDPYPSIPTEPARP